MMTHVPVRYIIDFSLIGDRVSGDVVWVATTQT